MDPLAALRRAPDTAALFLDFDGTLAAIVPRAADARPLPGVTDLLTGLSATLRVVAIVSGRPVAFLQSHLPAGLELHGIYGLESVVDGALVHHPAGAPWRAVVDEVVLDARASGPDGMDVEHKGLSLTLHFRRRPELADAVAIWAAGAAERSGLLVRPAKMSVELHPPVSVDKGSVVEARAAGCTAVAYVGDDDGDLPAFAALDRLARDGTDTVKIAVRTPDASAALLAAADHQVDGPAGAVELLRTLLD